VSQRSESNVRKNSHERSSFLENFWKKFSQQRTRFCSEWRSSVGRVLRHRYGAIAQSALNDHENFALLDWISAHLIQSAPD
jgi:hypothetical protein